MQDKDPCGALGFAVHITGHFTVRVGREERQPIGGLARPEEEQGWWSMWRSRKKKRLVV